MFNNDLYNNFFWFLYLELLKYTSHTIVLKCHPLIAFYGYFIMVHLCGPLWLWIVHNAFPIFLSPLKTVKFCQKGQ
jgi:hypothetical protein